MTTASTPPATMNMERARNLLIASFVPLVGAGILLFAALIITPPRPGPFVTDLSTLAPDQLTRFQQAAGINRQNTAAPLEMLLPRENPANLELQKVLEDRGWRFYRHWGSTAAVPISEQQLLAALAQGPHAAIQAAAGADRPPTSDPLVNYRLIISSPLPLAASSMLRLAITLLGVSALMAVTAVVFHLK